jgi:hypothetical protein
VENKTGRGNIIAETENYEVRISSDDENLFLCNKIKTEVCQNFYFKKESVYELLMLIFMSKEFVGGN